MLSGFELYPRWVPLSQHQWWIQTFRSGGGGRSSRPCDKGVLVSNIFCSGRAPRVPPLDQPLNIVSSCATQL